MVEYYHASQVNGLISKESTWGTAVAGAKDLGLLQNITLNGNNNPRRITGLSSHATQQLMAGKFGLDGDFEFKHQHGRPYWMMAGGTVTHTPSTADITHAFAFTTNKKPTFSLDTSYDSTADIKDVIKGVLMKSLGSSLALDGEVTGKAGIAARDIDPSATTATAAVVDTNTVHPDYMGSVKTGVADSEAAITMVQNYDWTITDDGLDLLYGLNSRLPGDNAFGERLLEFRFAAAFTSNAEYQKFTGSAAGTLATGTPALTSAVLATDNGVSLGSGKRLLSATFHNALYATASKPVSLGSWVICEYAGWALAMDHLSAVDSIASASFGDS